MSYPPTSDPTPTTIGPKHTLPPVETWPPFDGDLPSTGSAVLDFVPLALFIIMFGVAFVAVARRKRLDAHGSL